MGTSDDEYRPARTTTAQSREFGAELRLVRQRAGLRINTIANDLGWSVAMLCKIEKGWRGTSTWEIGTLLGRCGADKPTRQRIMKLAHEPTTGLFVRPHEGKLPDDLLCLRIHEQRARTIANYEPMHVPALLQSESYARALLSNATDEPDVVNSFVRSRMERQDVLAGGKPPVSVFYIHEAALHLAVGDVETMHDQMMFLALACDSSKLSPRVIPMSAGNHAALQHPSTLLTFAESTKPLAYTHTDTATVFVDDEQLVKSHQSKHAALLALSLDVEQSRAVFTHWAGVYERNSLRVCS
jgi:transcriptional regulator with XRE-family HTH domain